MNYNNRIVSVVIPNYNKGKYIKDCIMSVIKQTYTEIEIIVVDDCSTDNSRDIIRDIAFKYNSVKPFFLDENGGVSKARNYGAKMAIGYYLTFLDSDDIYTNENKIKNEVEVIKKDNDIAFSQWTILSLDGKTISNKIAKRNLYSNRYGICKILSVSMSPYKMLRGYLFTKELFNKVGGYTFKHDFFEDFYFQCQLVLHGKLRYTKDFGEGYRYTPDGLSKNKILNSKEIINNIQCEIYKLLFVDQKIYYRLFMFFCKIKKRILQKLFFM